jgi:C2 domain
MTKNEIDNESMKDSLNWIDTGTGRFGRLFVEIIRCDELPNMDIGGFAGNKTDTFVSLVFEDAVVRTDIIDDCLAPRWMPWTKRAFIFHMYHSSSDIFIGVFDYDDSLNPTDDHDLIGRVSVDISNLRKDTEYNLTYELHTTSRMSNPSDKKIFRKRTGTISIRLRLEIDDERKLLLSTLEPPPPMYVNVRTRKDFRVVRATCEGMYNMDHYDTDYIYS